MVWRVASDVRKPRHVRLEVAPWNLVGLANTPVLGRGDDAREAHWFQIF